MNLILLVLASLALGPQGTEGKRAIETGFVVIDGVYNSELVAPLDILEHSRYRDADAYFRCFLVSPDGKPIKTAEGLTIHADYSFKNAPKLDVLVIPSTMTSMDKDLANKAYMDWVRANAEAAASVITLCDGAFPLGQTGLLDGRQATTFPGDQDRFAEMFPKIQVHRDVWFVHDGKFITSVGGAKSYEPALFLAHQWFGEAFAKRLAQGLVIDWDLARIPHHSFGAAPPRPGKERAP